MERTYWLKCMRGMPGSVRNAEVAAVLAAINAATVDLVARHKVFTQQEL
jgi:hypothetical protein